MIARVTKVTREQHMIARVTKVTREQYTCDHVNNT